MRAIIPVAGFGSRLRPHTHSLPKVLLNVAGKPILAYILDELKRQNIESVTIITGYKGDMIQQFVESEYDFDAIFVEQKELLGLGHAIFMAEPTFKGEDLMIILGDTIFDADLSLASQNNSSSLGVKTVKDPRRFGVVITNENGKVKELVEKPQTPISNLAIVGIYYIKNSILLGKSLKELIDNNIKTKNEYQLTDALQIMIEKGETFSTFPVEGWHDCGKKETLLDTNRFLLGKYKNSYNFKDSVILEPSFVGEGVELNNSVIGPYTSIAAGSQVNNSIVRDSIISNNAKVENIAINKSIIGNNAIVEGKFTELNLGSNSELTL